ncbi:mucin-2-like [Macrobrachium nipponense]|uniref:mucin-2-like n=1 Tax=Macrobrachium nipponense TaxID=159736 RepID=UPI0030C8A7BD
MALTPWPQVCLWLLVLLGSSASNSPDAEPEAFVNVSQNERHLAKREVQQQQQYYNASQIVNQFVGTSVTNGPPGDKPQVTEVSPDPWLFLGALDLNSSFPRDPKAALADPQGYDALVDTLLAQAFTADKILQNLLTSLVGGNITKDKEYIPYFLDKSAQLSTPNGNSTPEDTVQSVGILVVGQPCVTLSKYGHLPAVMLALPDLPSPVIQIDQKLQALCSCADGPCECDESMKENKQEATVGELGELSEALNPEDFNVTSNSYLSLLLASRIDKRSAVVQLEQELYLTQTENVTCTTTEEPTTTTIMSTTSTALSSTTPTNTPTSTTTTTTETPTTTATTPTETPTSTTTTPTETPTTTATTPTETPTTTTTTPTETLPSTTTTPTETTTTTTTTPTETPTTTTITPTETTTTTPTETPTTTTTTPTETTTTTPTETTTTTTITPTETLPSTTATPTETPTTITTTPTATSTYTTTTPTETTTTTTTTPTETPASTTTESTTEIVDVPALEPMLPPEEETIVQISMSGQKVESLPDDLNFNQSVVISNNFTEADLEEALHSLKTSENGYSVIEAIFAQNNSDLANESLWYFMDEMDVVPLESKEFTPDIHIGHGLSITLPTLNENGELTAIIFAMGFVLEEASPIVQIRQTIIQHESGCGLGEATEDGFLDDNLMINHFVQHYANSSGADEMDTSSLTDYMKMLAAVPEFVRETRNFSMLLDADIPCEENTTTTVITTSTTTTTEIPTSSTTTTTETPTTTTETSTTTTVMTTTETPTTSTTTTATTTIETTTETPTTTTETSTTTTATTTMETTTGTSTTTTATTTTETTTATTTMETPTTSTTTTATTTTETPSTTTRTSTTTTATTTTEAPTTTTGTSTTTTAMTTTEAPTTTMETSTTTTETSTTTSKSPTTTTATTTTLSPTSSTSTSTQSTTSPQTSTTTTGTTSEPEDQPLLQPLPPKQEDVIVQINMGSNVVESPPDDLNFSQTVVINNTFTNEDLNQTLQSLQTAEKAFSILETLFFQNNSDMGENPSWFFMEGKDLVVMEDKDYRADVHIGHGLSILLPTLDENGVLNVIVLIIGSVLVEAKPIVQIRQTVLQHEDCACGLTSNETIGNDFLDDNLLISHFVQQYENSPGTENMNTTLLTEYMKMLAAVPEYTRETKNFSMLEDVDIPCKSLPVIHADYQLCM